MKRTLITIVIGAGLSINCYAGLITHNDYVAGAVITSAGQNTNENAVFNEFNGNIESTNIKTGGVSTANLADGSITTAKLNSALTPTISSATITTVFVTSMTVSTVTVQTGIVGTTTNNSAPIGDIGEYVADTLPGLTNFGATGTWADYTSISLTAGDWDVTFVGTALLNGATATSWLMGISTTAGNSATGLTDRNTVNSEFNSAGSTLNSQSIPCVRMSLSGTTVVYGKYQAVYSAGGPPRLQGGISARRVR